MPGLRAALGLRQNAMLETVLCCGGASRLWVQRGRWRSTHQGGLYLWRHPRLTAVPQCPTALGAPIGAEQCAQPGTDPALLVLRDAPMQPSSFI